MNNWILFTLNGRAVRWEGSASERLMDVLRRDCGITSLRCGCGDASCGMCTVLLDGTAVNACLLSMGRIADRDIETLEGFRVLSECFSECGAVHCGSCTPGMLLTAHSLLSASPHPSEAEIRDALTGHLCRCGGINAIVRAIAMAAERGRGLW